MSCFKIEQRQPSQMTVGSHNKGSFRALIVALSLSSGLSLWVLPAVAQTATTTLQIQDGASCSFQSVDPADIVQKTSSNDVVVTATNRVANISDTDVRVQTQSEVSPNDAVATSLVNRESQ